MDAMSLLFLKRGRKKILGRNQVDGSKSNPWHSFFESLVPIRIIGHKSRQKFFPRNRCMLCGLFIKTLQEKINKYLFNKSNPKSNNPNLAELPSIDG